MIQKFKDFNKTKVISAFPGTGKSYFYKNNNNSIDSDSSKFDKTFFPDNYIEHIKENIGKYKYIFVSSHKEVRDSMIENNIDFTLIYPDKSLKEEYINRYKERGNNDNFIKLLNDKWDEWIDEIEEQQNLKKKILNKNEYISDIIYKI